LRAPAPKKHHKFLPTTGFPKDPKLILIDRPDFTSAEGLWLMTKCPKKIAFDLEKNAIYPWHSSHQTLIDDRASAIDPHSVSDYA
jgi:hypothetical protein